MLRSADLPTATLCFDLAATINRIHLHGDERELQLLCPEQVEIYLEATGQKPEQQSQEG